MYHKYVSSLILHPLNPKLKQRSMYLMHFCKDTTIDAGAETTTNYKTLVLLYLCPYRDTTAIKSS